MCFSIIYLYSFYEGDRSIYKSYNISPQFLCPIVVRYCREWCSFATIVGWRRLCYCCGCDTLCSSVLPGVSLLQDSQVLRLCNSVIRTPGSFFSLLLVGLLWCVVSLVLKVTHFKLGGLLYRIFSMLNQLHAPLGINETCAIPNVCLTRSNEYQLATFVNAIRDEWQPTLILIDFSHLDDFLIEVSIDVSSCGHECH